MISASESTCKANDTMPTHQSYWEVAELSSLVTAYLGALNQSAVEFLNGELPIAITPQACVERHPVGLV